MKENILFIKLCVKECATKTQLKLPRQCQDDIAKLAKDELDLIVMGQLLVNINIGEIVTGLIHISKEKDQ